MTSVAESMSRKCRRNSIRSHSLQTFFDERDLREDLERRAQQAVLGENSAQRKLYLAEYEPGDSELRAKKFKHHRGLGEEKELRKVGVKNIATNTFSFLVGKSKGKSLDDSNCRKSLTHHARVSGVISSEMRLGKFTRPNGISKLDREFPSRSLLEGEVSHTRLAVDQGNGSSQITG